MRLFVGIPLADSVRAELARLVDRLRSTADLRWSVPDSWHITLQFLGSTSEEQYQCLIAKLSGILSAPVPVRLDAVGVFERTGVFYAGVEVGPELAMLQQRVIKATAWCGFDPESRPFRPHITLARSKGQNRARELRTLLAKVPAGQKFAPFVVVEFWLYESHLSPAGSTYEVRRRFQLET